MTDRRRIRSRRGFALLTILWITTVSAVVAMGAAVLARHGVVEGAARVWLERARWEALACERRTIASIDAVLRAAGTSADAAVAWRTLPRELADAPPIAACDVRLEAAGTRLDVNRATDEMLSSLLDAVGLESSSPELVDALEDWIDDDDDARPNGAEREWYAVRGRLLPRNDSLADIRELERVRGFEASRWFDSVLTTEPGRISLATAPVSVLMAVPGITRETAEELVARQLAGTPVDDLLDVTASISASSASALAARYADAVRLTTPDPDAWVIRVRAALGSPAVAVQLQWRVVRTGRRCLVASTRSAI